MAGHPDFDGWRWSIVEPGLGEGWGMEDRQKGEEFLRRWLRNFFNEHGPEARDVVASAFVQDQVGLATDNVSIVMPDIERTSGLRPTIVVDEYFGAVRISFNGNYTTPSMWAWENPEALIEVAGYLQEQMWDGGLWPLCPRHVQVLLPEVRGATTTWWCRTGEHAVARIGDLGLPQIT